jgi:hypothetical protein
MIKLQIAIGEGDVQPFYFQSVNDLVDYIKECKSINAIWLATDEATDEILITENIEKIIIAILFDYWDLALDKDSIFYLQEYQSYEDAFAVALSMKENNPKCYN